MNLIRKVLGRFLGSKKEFQSLTTSQVREACRMRIARLFRVSPEEVRERFVLGEDLDAKVGILPNALDELDEDVVDLCQLSQDIDKDVKAGNLRLESVGDYCDIMVRAYQIDPDYVKDILRKELQSRNY